MERRHQVFISSTFTDLVEERAEIVQALLELDCFPAGMELFPATNEAAWDLIKRVIDDSDYYCLVVGGRYGSVDDEGLSYTEREYDYAFESGKPLIAFLHADPGKILSEKAEVDVVSRDRLRAFREKVEKNHHCKYWSSPEDLGSKVSRAMVALRKSHPSDGWVPGAFAADESSRIELANLRAQVAELQSEIAQKTSTEAVPQVDNLAFGDDLFTTTVAYRDNDGEVHWANAKVSWDTILKYVGPTLLNECSDEELVEKLKLCFYHALFQKVSSDQIKNGSVVLTHISLDQIKIQLRALGQMAPGTKRRAVSDRKNYWKLTASGEQRLISVQAIPRATPA